MEAISAAYTYLDAEDHKEFNGTQIIIIMICVPLNSLVPCILSPMNTIYCIHRTKYARVINVKCAANSA